MSSRTDIIFNNFIVSGDARKSGGTFDDAALGSNAFIRLYSQKSGPVSRCRTTDLKPCDKAGLDIVRDCVCATNKLPPHGGMRTVKHTASERSERARRSKKWCGERVARERHLGRALNSSKQAELTLPQEVHQALHHVLNYSIQYDYFSYSLKVKSGLVVMRPVS